MIEFCIPTQGPILNEHVLDTMILWRDAYFQLNIEDMHIEASLYKHPQTFLADASDAGCRVID